jgi:hypothetical protein
MSIVLFGNQLKVSLYLIVHQDVDAHAHLGSLAERVGARKASGPLGQREGLGHDRFEIEFPRNFGFMLRTAV